MSAIAKVLARLWRLIGGDRPQEQPAARAQPAVPPVAQHKPAEPRRRDFSRRSLPGPSPLEARRRARERVAQRAGRRIGNGPLDAPVHRPVAQPAIKASPRPRHVWLAARERAASAPAATELSRPRQPTRPVAMPVSALAA